MKEGVDGWASVSVCREVHRWVQNEEENELVCKWAWKMTELMNEALIITIR